ncbi:MAG: hypothetical protein IJT66_05920, partial [Clostridia bacterium]|nr:hypothetical protein [Clostridia bacterium]
MKAEKQTITGMIVSGAEIADICATAGDPGYQYSSVYARFNIRGKNVHYTSNNTNGYTELVKYSDNIVAQGQAKVQYILNEGNGYNDMAKVYRSYLISEGMQTNCETPPAFFNILGGAVEQRHIVGIPYHTVKAFTTIAQADEIITDLKQNLNSDFAVNLKGFGNTGLDYGEIGGGFRVASAFGTKKDFQQLVSLCDRQGIDLFYDFEMIFYNRSSNGFQKNTAATNASELRAKFSPYHIVTRDTVTAEGAFLADRYTLLKAGNLINSALQKMQINGASMSSLCNTAYSDFKKTEYYNKAHMSDDVKYLMDSVKKEGNKVFGQTANAYAAMKLDYNFDTPLSSSMYNAFDEDIPFYQMIFRGSSAISGAAINTASNPETV